MKTIENQGFLTTPNAVGRSEAVKMPANFKISNKINGFEHVSYGTALKSILQRRFNECCESLILQQFGLGPDCVWNREREK